jgi:hypothetical protein
MNIFLILFPTKLYEFFIQILHSGYILGFLLLLDAQFYINNKILVD